ncbi:MAG: glycosyltransferase family 2 protein [Patescibacteria group bacterium]|nr:glycosyltransferase family 2 protein [Patescibacteria group bacterium]
MAEITENHKFTRALEIFPGALAWTIILFPLLASPFFPMAVAIFIIIFNIYWVAKALNMIRHLLSGYFRMKRNMSIDWLKRTQKVSKSYKSLITELKKEFARRPSLYLREDIAELENLLELKNPVKKYEDIYHLVIVTNYKESYEITYPTYDAIRRSNYSNKKIIVLGTGEASRDKKGWDGVKKKLKKEFGDSFAGLFFNDHYDKPGDVIGKGPNLSSAGYEALKYLKKEWPNLAPENVMVTTLDADHIVETNYFARLTYKYIIDPNRLEKTYQPVGLLFNNIWDAPAPNRIAAIASSFWQIIEGMRPYRLRTFASHAQPLATLIKTDFWSTKTIVEDGHQYWRTYFAFGGDHDMVPLLIPVYQDCVLAEKFVDTFKNQYNQRKRWAWGISDFPYVVKMSIRHKEIPLHERLLQIFRLLSGHISWSTASLFLAFAWLPLTINRSFQDTVMVHNMMTYGSLLMRVAWLGIVANAWVYLSLLPQRPERYGPHRYINMIAQWVFIAPVSIFISSIPALEAQTRLMLGKYMNVFWLTPKYRRESPLFGAHKKK